MLDFNELLLAQKGQSCSCHLCRFCAVGPLVLEEALHDVHGPACRIQQPSRRLHGDISSNADGQSKHDQGESLGVMSSHHVDNL